MIEHVARPAAAPAFDPGFTASGSAGQMLRRAREARGLPIDALAASIKVTVRKLELLEADRFDELPDATFTRALAQTVCRSLKLDAQPVLALLPSATGHRIEQVSEGLNAPFRDRPSRLDGLAWGALLKVAWAPVVLLALAALVAFLPAGSMQSGIDSVSAWWRSLRPAAVVVVEPSGAATVAGAGQAAPSEAGVPQTAVETVYSAPPSGSAASSAAVAPASSAGPLQLRATAESWVEVKDGRDRVLFSRLLQPGETVTLDGALPMRVKIGNASVTEVRFRGAEVDIAPMTNENIARIELR